MKKSNNLTLKIITVLFTILIIFLVYFKIKNNFNKEAIIAQKTDTLFSTIDKNLTVSVSKYIVYGTHFNIEGTISIPDISGIYLDNADVIVKDIDNNEVTLKSDYSYKDSILSFSTIDELNSGLYLEDLAINNYYILLKVTFSNSDVKYYSLSNATDYEDIEYYTITKNDSNNKIDIIFSKYDDIDFMGITVSKASVLPDDVCDIVIDPGHGGSDSGAISNGYYESNVVLNCALTLKSKLEDLGLKVLLTRDGSESKDDVTAYNMYDDNGRVTIANESGAKVLISLHLNSNSTDVSSGGVEVYAPCECDLTLAKMLADNIVKNANTSYSKLSTFKKEDGVYVRNFNNADILGFKAKAINSGYEPYNITTTTPYLYMIREIGGICTNAFVDGRNTEYSANKYYNSNVGIEGYLIELGYMIIDEDLQNVISNGDLYMQGIADSISEFYNLNN